MLRRLTVRPLAVERVLPSRTMELYFSSSVAPKLSQDDTKLEKQHPQPFVEALIQPGEWDENRTDPYFRPRPHARSTFISAEDFANRPPVGFDGEFTSYQDAMISLSWMDQRTSKEIYSMYTTMMVGSQDKHKATSHEYVVRVVAERFHLTTARAAGIIQLQHAEEQMRRNNPELLCPEHAQLAEDSILENIRDAYKASGQQQGPAKLQFIEDPVGIHGRGEPDETSTQWSNLDDIFDMEQKLAQATVRDSERAKIIIDNHMYKVDNDDQEQLVKVDASGHKLIARKDKLKKAMGDVEGHIPYPETNGKGEKRERWKYVAQVVNTRSLKKKQHGKGKASSTSYTNNKMGNTLVEHNGDLRIATVAEAKQTAWKPTRTKSNEYLFEGAKRAWLEKTLKGKTDVWGPAPRTKATESMSVVGSPSTTTTEMEENIETQSETEVDEKTDQTMEKDDLDSSSKTDKASEEGSGVTESPSKKST